MANPMLVIKWLLKEEASKEYLWFRDKPDLQPMCKTIPLIEL